MNKFVYRYSPITSQFIGSLELGPEHEDPLNPGTFLMPGGCLEVRPPTAPSGSAAYAENGVWVVKVIPVEPEPELPKPPPDPSKVNEPPPPTNPVDSLTVGIQGYMDAMARSLRYDDLKTAVGYRGDPNPKFAAEAETFFLWRSAVWTACYAYLALVQAGQKPFPTLEEAIAMLPVLTLPTWEA